MRILQVIADGNPGGGTTVVLELICNLIKQGHELALVSQQDSYALKQAGRYGAEIHGLDFFRSRLDLSVSGRLRRIIAQARPDVVHAHGGRAGFFLSFVPKSARPCPLTYTVHGYHFLNKPFPTRQLAALAERRAHAGADVSIHGSRYDRRLATSWGLLPQNHPNIVVYNGIDPSEIPPAKDTQLKSVGFLARLTHPKNPLFVLEVARLLAPEGYTFKLIGGGELEPQVRERIRQYGLQGSVSLTGTLPRAEALEVLRDVGTTILPSLWEVVPLAAMEAMQMGIPVVAANVSGFPEIIRSDVSGVLIRDYDPRRYAEAIQDLADAPQKRQRMIAEGRRVVAEKFTLERMVTQHLELYEALLQKQSLQV